MNSIDIHNNEENNGILVKKKTRDCRIGALIFAVIHFFYEIFSHGIPAAVVFNYYIAMFFLKQDLINNNENQITRAIRIACIVFIVRIMLGTSYLFLFLR